MTDELRDRRPKPRPISSPPFFSHSRHKQHEQLNSFDPAAQLNSDFRRTTRVGDTKSLGSAQAGTEGHTRSRHRHLRHSWHPTSPPSPPMQRNRLRRQTVPRRRSQKDHRDGPTLSRAAMQDHRNLQLSLQMKEKRRDRLHCSVSQGASFDLELVGSYALVTLSRRVQNTNELAV